MSYAGMKYATGFNCSYINITAIMLKFFYIMCFGFADFEFAMSHEILRII